MRPAWHHRICARPLAICWLVGALILWVPATMSLQSQGIFPAAFSDTTTVLLLLLGYACLGGMGFFVGAIPLCWLVARVCSWVNGGPFAIGDRVTIITGREAGKTTTVYELVRGQGGYLLPKLELGEEAREKHLDIFDDYTLLRVPGTFHRAPVKSDVA